LPGFWAAARRILRLDDSKIVESEEVSPGVVLDFNEANEGNEGDRGLGAVFG
jgi:hypothetical protein